MKRRRLSSPLRIAGENKSKKNDNFIATDKQIMDVLRSPEHAHVYEQIKAQVVDTRKRKREIECKEEAEFTSLPLAHRQAQKVLRKLIELKRGNQLVHVHSPANGCIWLIADDVTCKEDVLETKTKDGGGKSAGVVDPCQEWNDCYDEVELGVTYKKHVDMDAGTAHVEVDDSVSITVFNGLSVRQHDDDYHGETFALDPYSVEHKQVSGLALLHRKDIFPDVSDCENSIKYIDEWKFTDGDHHDSYYAVKVHPCTEALNATLFRECMYRHMSASDVQAYLDEFETMFGSPFCCRQEE